MKLIHSQKFSEKICDKQMCPIKNTKGSLSGIKEMTPDANSNWREKKRERGTGREKEREKRTKERNRRENLSEKRRNIQLCVHNGKLK